MRDFTDSIKFSVVRDNLEKNNGRICCEICGKELKSINECHFDHIEAYAKGGKSIKTNCQILCSDCNLKKNDKELADFLLDEKAKKFLEGNIIDEDGLNIKKENDSLNNINIELEEMTKEKFDIMVSSFIADKGNITKVDFNRVYNNLPPIKYVYKYYGDFSSLKQEFNLKQIVWNRETIKEALENYVKIHGDIFQKDLKTCNGFPSYPCIIKYYPEYEGLNELKNNLFNLKIRNQWTKEKVIDEAKRFVQKNGKITLKDLTLKNNLPTARVIYKYFGTMENFQKLVGSQISKKNELITISDIDKYVEELFQARDRIFNTRKDLLDVFPVSESVIYKNFGTFDLFCEKYNIVIKKKKKAKFTKQEIDDIILAYIKGGNSIPKVAKDLVKLGLPSRDVIMRYYKDWHEPFILYSKLYEKIN